MELLPLLLLTHDCLGLKECYDFRIAEEGKS